MKSIFTFLILSICISFSLVAQDEIIIGETYKEKLENNDQFKWFDENYSDFNTTPKQIEILAQLFKDNTYKIEVYFGTWCSDSQREVPKLLKILDESKFDYSNLKLVGVPESKEVPNVSEKIKKELNILNVPTIIVYKNNKEVNRFVEYPKETLEEDLIKILSNQPYKHSYY